MTAGLSARFLPLPSEDLVIEGGTLIDGTGRPPVENSIVVVRGNRIVAAGKKGEVQGPKGSPVISAEGKFILPGLIDLNVHYREWQGELYLAHGVTTVKDTGNPIEWLEQMSAAISSGRVAGPRLFYTGNSLTSPPAVKDHHVCLTDPEMARRAVRILKEHGADAVKVGQQISLPLLQAISAEAHSLGIPVTGHLRLLGARQAAEAGIDGLEHTTGVPRSTGPRPDWAPSDNPASDLAAYYDDLREAAEMQEQKFAPLIRVLISRHVSITPTLFTWFRVASDRRADYAREDAEYSRILELSYVPEKVVKSWRNPTIYDPPGQAELRTFRLAYMNVGRFLKEFHDAGGAVLAGSATGDGVPGLGMLREMEAMRDLGLPPAEIIEISTRQNARFLRKDNELGTISPGKLADIIVVDGNPLQDLSNLRHIAVVIKDGAVIDAKYHSEYHAPVPRPNLTRPLWLDLQLKGRGVVVPTIQLGGE
jgi:imidazolonepropionase-like amidohydrolase